ncbi:hypothetical protein [Galenea microaerophila]
MVEFLKKAMNWALTKEAEAARNCAIDPEEIDQQIQIIEAKRAEIRKKFEEDDAELAHILKRLKLIKTNAQNCKEI